MSFTWKTGYSVSLEKGDWNIAIQQDWSHPPPANKYSCENMDMSPQESQRESQTDYFAVSTNKHFGICPEDKSTYFHQLNTADSLQPSKCKQISFLKLRQH